MGYSPKPTPKVYSPKPEKAQRKFIVGKWYDYPVGYNRQNVEAVQYIGPCWSRFEGYFKRIDVHKGKHILRYTQIGELRPEPRKVARLQVSILAKFEWCIKMYNIISNIHVVDERQGTDGEPTHTGSDTRTDSEM